MTKKEKNFYKAKLHTYSNYVSKKERRYLTYKQTHRLKVDLPQARSERSGKECTSGRRNVNPGKHNRSHEERKKRLSNLVLVLKQDIKNTFVPKFQVITTWNNRGEKI